MADDIEYMGEVYAIRNKVTGDEYIGSTERPRTRWQNHRYLLRNGKHTARLLQAAWDKYGEAAFEWVVLEEVEYIPNCSISYRLKCAEEEYRLERKPAYSTRTASNSPRQRQTSSAA